MAKRGPRRKVLKGSWISPHSGRAQQSQYSPYNFIREMECGHHKPIDADAHHAYCSECLPLEEWIKCPN